MECRDIPFRVALTEFEIVIDFECINMRLNLCAICSYNSLFASMLNVHDIFFTFVFKTLKPTQECILVLEKDWLWFVVNMV